MYKRKFKSGVGSLASSKVLTNSSQSNVQSTSTDEIELQTKRSRIEPSKKTNPTSSPPKNPSKAYFKEVLLQCGFKINYADNLPHALYKEQEVVARDIQKCLIEADDYPRNIYNFMNGLKDHCSQIATFNKTLNPTQLERSSEFESISGVLQECLLRILLTVDCLQPHIIEFIIEKITDCAAEDEDNTSFMHKLLRPLCFLPYIQKEEDLSKNLIDVLSVASSVATQSEIICCLPNILPDSQHDEAAIELSKLLRENSELTPSVVDCFSQLVLSETRSGELRTTLLTILQSSIPLDHLPTLVHYLLTTWSGDDVIEVIHGLRKGLDFMTVGKSSNEDIETNQVLTFSTIRTALGSKQLVDAWLKVINGVKVHTDHRPIDIVVIFILQTVAVGKRKLVESILRKKINSGCFKTTLLETTIKKYMTISLLKEYTQEMLNTAAGLLRMKAGSLVIDFAISIYISIFNHANIGIQERQAVVCALISLIADDYDDGSVLKILSHLSEKYTALMQPHALLLLGLLDKLSDMPLTKAHQILNVLCTLAFSNEAGTASANIQDDIHLIVQKQLRNCNQDIKILGVIGAVLAVKYIASNNDNESLEETADDDRSFNDISELPTEVARQAATLLELVTLNTRGFTEAMGLYHDQLGSMLSSTGRLEKHFLTWLTLMTTNDFQNIFIIEDVPQPANDITFSMQFCVNDTQEEENPIAINIGGLCIQSKKSEHNDLILLAPLFRSLRLLHFKENAGDLSSIDALLGCSIIMPNIDSNGGFEALDPCQLKLVLDCYFHCANWFREVINAFVSQKSTHLHSKVLARLSGLIQLEKQIAVYLESASPNYRPPPSHFPNTLTHDQSSPLFIKPASTASKGRSRKKKQVDTQNVLAGPSQIKTQSQSESSTEKRSTGSGVVKRIYFRDLDTDILLLLREPLHIVPYDASVEDDTEPRFGLCELKFILEDVVDKLKTIVDQKTGTRTKEGNILSNLHIVKDEHLINDCIKLMPRVMSHLQIIGNYIQALLDGCDGVRDAAGMFVPGSVEAKLCIELLLQYQALTFAWVGFQSPLNSSLLRDGLRALVDEEHSGLRSTRELVLHSTNRVMQYAEYTLHLAAGVSLIHLMQSLVTLTPETAPRKKVVTLSQDLLSRSWCDLNGKLDVGSNYNVQIDILIKAYLSNADVETVHGIVLWLQDEVLLLKTKNDRLQTFPSITKLNFPLLYRALCSALVNAVRDKINSQLTRTQHLTMWKTVVTSLQGLMNIVKLQELKTNLAAFLRRSLELLKIFLSQGMPILEISLRSEPDTVIEILRIMQQSTRFLHNLCCHLKVNKDSGSIGLVPPMRLTLETLVYRVKAALVANDCSSAFWMGNLRNKDIHGESILSQTSEGSSVVSSLEEEEEELPPDEESGDDLDARNEDELSTSEIF